MTTETLLIYYFLLLRDIAHLLLALFLLLLFEISAPRIDLGRTRLRRGHPPLTALPRARQKLEIGSREWVLSSEQRSELKIRTPGFALLARHLPPGTAPLEVSRPWPRPCSLFWKVLRGAVREHGLLLVR